MRRTHLSLFSSHSCLFFILGGVSASVILLTVVIAVTYVKIMRWREGQTQGRESPDRVYLDELLAPFGSVRVNECAGPVTRPGYSWRPGELKSLGTAASPLVLIQPGLSPRPVHHSNLNRRWMEGPEVTPIRSVRSEVSSTQYEAVPGEASPCSVSSELY